MLVINETQFDWDAIGNALADEGFWIGQNILPCKEVYAWREVLRGLPAKYAGTGQFGIKSNLRTDSVSWLKDEPKELIKLLDAIKQGLNQSCFLGIHDYEAHYARYECGGHYAPHIDAFQQNNRRILSAVLYLNENWRQENGGQLRLYVKGEFQDIQPTCGTLVLFRSTDILHEVVRSERPRESVACWFRLR
jgi:SM-20-related protein